MKKTTGGKDVPTGHPPGITEKELDKDAKELASFAETRAMLAETGPCSAPPIQKSAFNRYFRQWFEG